MPKPAFAFIVTLGLCLGAAAPQAQAQFEPRNGSPFFFAPSMPPPYIQQQIDQDRREMRQYREDLHRREMARDPRDGRQGFQPEPRGWRPENRQGFAPPRGPMQGQPRPYNTWR